MAERILVVDNVTKTYPGVKALDQVSLAFEKGEIHALVGENGAGKSTIIKTIAGAIKPDSGAVLFEGKDLTKMKTSEIRGCGIEVVYQEFNLALQLPVYENIFIGNLAGKGPGNRLADKKYMVETTKKLFEKLGIRIDPESRVDSLSVAYMQFVEIAKAVSRNVRILIMDVKYSIVLIVYGVYRVREKLKIGTTYTNRKKNVYDVTWKRIRKILKSGIGSGSFFIP